MFEIVPSLFASSVIVTVGFAVGVVSPIIAESFALGLVFPAASSRVALTVIVDPSAGAS